MTPKGKKPAKKLKSLVGRSVDNAKAAKVKGGATLKFRPGKGM